MLNSGDRLGRTASYRPDASDTTRAILGLLSERLRGSDDSGGVSTDTTLLSGLRSVPGISSAELRPADASPPPDGELFWPAGPGRLLAVVLEEGYNGHGIPEALSCLAAALEAIWRRDEETRADSSSDTTLAKAKTEFIGQVVHDLATPITPILAYAGLLSDPDTGPLTTDQREFVKVIERNALRLSELLNDLPLLADPASPELELRSERVDPMELLRDITAQFRPGAMHAGITLRYQARPGPALNCNAIRIRRMFDLLLTTAITRSHPGGTVEVDARPTVDGWWIDVICLPATSEAGPGDAAERREQPAGETAWPRIGMARAIAGMHGGTIDITDQGTKGSVIRVELPWEPLRDRREAP
ncbi:HAMP domain-containing histidine kinase [Planomonospora sp. ID67723]|uniref:sensor histidine kinase n=1 Tax=Planomonospora sp. ID67723 TaxID=2738134 RepID=UPI0018C3C309|nr:HAMP domain-containing sensor histidine kinase [Planomonospora sp. ID67723]MBG0833351.1 HAMP domain-containing histidine kinase [Planomonospora sp. ID67723]